MLKDIKFYFENLFATKWTETSIHFGGQEFDPKALGISKWVNPYYTPTRTRAFGLGDNASIYYGDLYVVCWQKNDVEAMELADNVAKFINDNVDKHLFKLRGYDVVDHAWDSTNKAYIILSFTIETIRGVCGEDLPQKIKTRIVHGGVQVTHNNVILTK